MTRWSFLWSPRWLGYLALVLVFAVICSLLGAWQFARRGEARTEIERIDANYDAPAVPITSLLPTLDSFDDDTKWSPVLIEGHYLVGEQMLVRGRPFNGRAGFEVLVPLQLADGTVFIVNRGWIPVSDDGQTPTSIPAAPAGPVTVAARLKAGEVEIEGRTTVDAIGTGAVSQLATIHLPEIADRLDRPTYTGAYGLVVSESPQPADAPFPSARPVRDEGPHLSYALQWYVFALLGFIGYGWAIRHEYRVLNADDPLVRAAAEERRRRKAERAPTDAEIEDEVIDSASPQR